MDGKRCKETMRRSAMNRRKRIVFCTVCFMMLVAGTVYGQSDGSGEKAAPPFPSYGIGKTIVRIYTDYFCPPCRAAEPKLEQALENAFKRGVVTVTFVDTPIYQHSPLYARYFLYVINGSNSFERAMAARKVLFEAAEKKITEKEKLEGFLKEKGISFVPFDVRPVLGKLNELLRNDKVDATPSAVVAEDGKVRKLTGGADITNAVAAIR